MTLNENFLSLKRQLFDKYFASLNEPQRKAVYTVNNPLLILAGAGSGKTTVLVKRIGFIIQYGNAYYSNRIPYGLTQEKVQRLEQALNLSPDELPNVLSEFIDDPCPPWRVLAITFTNKAANEIKNRLVASLGNEELAGQIWAGTFHSVCMRILRVHCERLGYAKEFSIYDADDAKKAVTAVMKQLNIDEKTLAVKTVLTAISHAKDSMLSPEEYTAEAGNDYRLKKIAEIYAEYQRTLRRSNAMDFDDIIMQTVLLLKNNDDVCETYADRFRYVCVDEFQDTNKAQLALTTLLSVKHRNLMVVGDDDQSIYRFRGATIDNILSFDRLFADAAVIKLEQNYRSTGNILQAANAVIANNTSRHSKSLWTDKGAGSKLHLLRLEDQNEEARAIVDLVHREVAAKRHTYRDFAVLYRTNAQSNNIEKAFNRAGVPYRLLGGTRFSDRKEIRDLLAYLYLINNPGDRERLLRIINEPRRKIGDKTLEAVEQIAVDMHVTMFDVMENAAQYVALARSASQLMAFTAVIRGLQAIKNSVSLSQLIDNVLDRTGYRQMLIDAGEEEKERLDNLDEFKSNAVEYEQNSDEPTLTGFLEENALVADVDKYDESADAVVLMTIHSAKGLEFPIVFLPGMEDGLFPSGQTLFSSEDELEEERRLAYVAITRAKNELYLMHVGNRLLYGKTMANPVSRFVDEIPPELVEKTNRFGGTQPAGTATGAATVRHYDVGYSPANSGKTTVKTPDFSAVLNPFGTQTVKKPEPVPVATFAAGDTVVHELFGTGTILSVKPMAKDCLYEIVFDKVGTKRLMGSYAKLKKA